MVKTVKTSKIDYFYWFMSIGTLVTAIVAHILSWLPKSQVLSISILVGLVVLASFIFLQTVVGKNSMKLWQEAVVELHRVVWPEKKDIVHTTLVVLLMVVVMSIIMWLIDSTLLSCVAKILGS